MKRAVNLIGLSIGLLAGCGLHLKPGDTYQSRRGNFTCVVPSDLIAPIDNEVERYEGDNTFLSFSDAYGDLFRIESSPIPPEYQSRVAAMDQQELLDAMFDRVLMPVEFLKASPMSNVERREMVDTSAGKALYCVVFIPGGNTLETSDGSGSYHRQNSTRGVLTFIKNRYVYVVSNQLLRPPFMDDTDHLLAELQETVAHMTFH